MIEIREKGERTIKQDATLKKIKEIGLNMRQEKAIKYIIKNGKINVNEYQDIVGCIRRTAQRDLEDLTDKKVVKPVGKSLTDPTKYYVLL